MIKLKKLLNEGKYPKSSHKWSSSFKYMFSLYLKGGDKHHSDYYDLSGIKKMKSILDKDKQVYTIFMFDKNGEGDEIHL